MEGAAPQSSKLVAVVEKNTEFWKGIPYGSRSSVNALTITCFADFINEKEHVPFFEWLLETKDTWLGHMQEHGGITAQRWADNNMAAILRKEWSAVYVPRFTYGSYLAEKLNKIVDLAEAKGRLTLVKIEAEAVDIAKMPSGKYEVTLEVNGGGENKLEANKVVVATGSGPVGKLCVIEDTNALYLNDIYEPSVEDNLNLLKATLENVNNLADRNVLIVGSNASSIELLYLLEGKSEIKGVINKIVIVSASGAIPYHTSTQQLEIYPLPALDGLEAKGGYNITALVAAAESDMKLALTDGANMDYVAALIKTTLKMMEGLGELAKKEFFGIYALRLRDKFRRAGPEYKNTAQKWIDSTAAILLKGRFMKMVKGENGLVLEYKDVDNGNLEEYSLQFNAVINCTGTADLDGSASRLLSNIVNKKLCNTNLSKKGLEVNEKFEAAPNLYVIGPLLGGNVNKLIHFWQLENASRLTYLAPYLAQELVG
jgi:uncharacterized NAD(P)/FAD-binding protein YdhS